MYYRGDPPFETQLWLAANLLILCYVDKVRCCPPARLLLFFFWRSIPTFSFLHSCILCLSLSQSGQYCGIPIHHIASVESGLSTQELHDRVSKRVMCCMTVKNEEFGRQDSNTLLLRMHIISPIHFPYCHVFPFFDVCATNSVSFSASKSPAFSFSFSPGVEV